MRIENEQVDVTKVVKTRFEGSEMDSLYFGDYVAIQSFEIDFEARRLVISVDSTLVCTKPKHWLGKGKLVIEGWSSWSGRSTDSVDEPYSLIHEDNALALGELDEVSVTQNAITLQGYGEDTLLWVEYTSGSKLLGRVQC
jgi:hypothetical protein